MTSVQDRGCPHWERPSVAPSVASPSSFLSSVLDDNISDQLTGPHGANLPIDIVPAAAPPVPKYTKEDLQRIFKTVLEV